MNQERDQELADLKRLQEYENRIAPLISASSGPASKSLLKTKKELQKKFETYCGYTEKQTQFLDEAAITVMQMKRMLKYCNIYLYFRPNGVEDKERLLFEQQMMQMTFTCDTLHVLVDPDEKNNAHEYVIISRVTVSMMCSRISNEYLYLITTRTPTHSNTNALEHQRTRTQVRTLE